MFFCHKCFFFLQIFFSYKIACPHFFLFKFIFLSTKKIYISYISYTSTVTNVATVATVPTVATVTTVTTVGR